MLKALDTKISGQGLGFLAPPGTTRKNGLRSIVAQAKRRNRSSSQTSELDADSLRQLASVSRKSGENGSRSSKQQTGGFGGFSGATAPSQKRDDKRQQERKSSKKVTETDDVDDLDPLDEGTLLAEDELTDTEYAEILGLDTVAPDTLDIQPELEEKLQRILAQFPFPLDAFQVQAFRHLLYDRSVVVCAPTGAGKTAIAEAAAIHFLERGQRVFYTTPLKALSNQKLRELRERFGVDSLGLKTGDASINIDAPVVVMTTEILRNMLYRAEGEGSDALIERFNNVGLVCLDECHYLGDPGRGSVWEETIINLPRHIRILAMSATVRNPDDLTGWIAEVHGECDTVATSFRPVPLNWHYCFSTSSECDSARLLPLLDDRGRAMNPALLSPKKRAELLANTRNKSNKAWGRWDSLSSLPSSAKNSSGKSGRGGRKGGSSSSSRTLDELISSIASNNDLSFELLGNEGGSGSDTDGQFYSESDDDLNKFLSGPRWKRIPNVSQTVKSFQERDMLPAIWFIFSRRECDLSALQIEKLDICLTTPEEREIIQSELDLLRADQPETVRESAVGALLRGAAAHHAGLLPGYKLLIEKLFQRGIIKLVFATETLAAGINMPAKTTVISALSRRRDNGIVSLTHNELLQMAGRAGRRGFDTIGHCVIMQSKWEDADVAWDIIRKGPEPLKSQFTASYGMALNLVYTRDLQQTREFLDRSFSRYLGGSGVVRVLKEAEQLEKKAQDMLEEAARRAGAAAVGQNPSQQQQDVSFIDDETNLWTRYQKLVGRAKEEKRALRLLRSQLSSDRGKLAENQLDNSLILDTDAVASIANNDDINQQLPKIAKPVVVGLDLSGTALEVDSYKLPAILLRRLDSSSSQAAASRSLSNTSSSLKREEEEENDEDNNEDTRVVSYVYICLGSDNMIYSVYARNIAGVLSSSSIDGGQGNGDDFHYKLTDSQMRAASTALEYATTIPLLAWQELSGGVRCIEGSALTAATAASLPPPADIPSLNLPESSLTALQEQKARLVVVKKEMSTIKSDQKFAKASRRYSQVAAKASVWLEKAAALREDVRERTDGGWMAFEAIVRVLETSGAIVRQGDGHMFQPLGLVAREVRAGNELWLASVLTHEALQLLQPPQLAAVLSSVVASEAFSRNTVWAAYPPSSTVVSAVEALEPARAHLSLLQIASQVEAPIAIDMRMAGIVEGWASGVDWTEVTADCGLDDGDVARLLTRTVDVLRQAAHCEHLLPGLRQSARRAAAKMDRKPISDLVS